MRNKYRSYKPKGNSLDKFDTIFETVVRRDEHCAFCWSEIFLHIHHKDKNRRNKKWDNLMLLCERDDELLHKFKP